MKAVLTFLVFAFILAGCNEDKERHYFTFDDIQHYSIEIEISDIFDDLDDLEAGDISMEGQLRLDVVFGKRPLGVEDYSLLDSLELIGFKKQALTRDKYDEINELFRTKDHEEIVSLACEPIFRDLLIFRNQGEISGMAKICFECLQHQIHGTTLDTRDFGQSGDYGKLENLLKL